MTTVDIGFVVAMKEEADILASSLDLSLTNNDTYQVFTDKKKKILLITPGVNTSFKFLNKPVSNIGKASAAAITTLLIEKYHPKIIVNAGTAGGIKSKGVHVGDIIVASAVANHDIRIPISGYREYGTRKLPLKRVNNVDTLTLPYRLGVVSSGESFTATSEDWKIMKQNQAIAKDMEAAGVAQAIEISAKLPLYIFKAITDLTDEDIQSTTSSSEFEHNFTYAINQLATFIQAFVRNKQHFLS